MNWEWKGCAKRGVRGYTQGTPQKFLYPVGKGKSKSVLGYVHTGNMLVADKLKTLDKTAVDIWIHIYNYV